MTTPQDIFDQHLARDKNDLLTYSRTHRATPCGIWLPGVADNSRRRKRAKNLDIYAGAEGGASIVGIRDLGAPPFVQGSVSVSGFIKTQEQGRQYQDDCQEWYVHLYKLSWRRGVLIVMFIVALTTAVVSLLVAVHHITGQDQSQPTATSESDPNASPSSSSTAAPSYTPIVSNHTNPDYNPANGDAGPGVNNSYSPPFPREATRGAGNWEYAINRAKEWITQYNLTLEEKVGLTTGVGWQGKGFGNRSCVGNIPPIERAGFRGLCLQDSPTGVR